jgi:hypothetical protein
MLFHFGRQIWHNGERFLMISQLIRYIDIGYALFKMDLFLIMGRVQNFGQLQCLVSSQCFVLTLYLIYSSHNFASWRYWNMHGKSLINLTLNVNTRFNILPCISLCFLSWLESLK